MSAVRIIRQSPPSLFQEEKVGEIVVQPGDRTPQIMQGVEATQLSSPIQRYEIREESQSPKIIFKHKASDRVRLKDAKVTISSLQERVSVIEKERREEKRAREEEKRAREEEKRAREEEKRAREEEKRAREEEKRLIMEWETCDRLAQGLNDSIKDAVTNEVNLSGAKVIWGSGNQYRYLPVLFTQWWLFSNLEDPDTYPLPPAFNPLNESDIDDFLSRQPLAPEISDAADLLWSSSHRPAIELMLMLYHKRLKARNTFQHPSPSVAFAHAIVAADASYSEEQKVIVNHIIHNGKRRDGDFLFTRSTSPTSSPSPSPSPAPAPAPAPASHAMGTTRGTTRQREVDDDGGVAVKKRKREE